jgi:hypothetical protein
MIDTTRTIEIENSPLKMVLLALVGILFVVLGIAFVQGWIDGPAPDAVVRLVGWASIVFFGFCTIVIVWRLFTQRGPVVTITPQGIRDIRIVGDFIPWKAVRSISTWSFQRQKCMVLAVEPAVEHKLPLTRMARMTRDMNRELGADGLCVAGAGLKMDYDTLLATSTAYWQAARGSPPQ